MLRFFNSTICLFRKLKFLSQKFFGILNHRDADVPKKSIAFIPTTIRAVKTVLLVALGNIAVAQNSDEPSNLGPFVLQLRTQNPLREAVNFASRPTPVAIDLDSDGDVDVMVADFDGGNGFDLLRNDGTNTNPAFNYATYWDNPFNYIAFDDGATPTFSDIDKDGDRDMLLGILDGTFRYYKNNPEATYKYSLQNSAWNPVTKSGNPFFGVDLGDYASPAFIDMDNDGDDDVVIGTSYLPNNKSMYYFINDGEGNFSEGTLQGINPALAEVTPTFIDVDQDGNKDIVIGAEDGNVYYFKRTGATSFEEQTGIDNPFNGINKGPYSSPAAADFDNDGDYDLIIGAQHATLDIFYFENKGNSIFEEKTGFDNPFGGIDVGQDASPYFTDFDNDGDHDLIIGNQFGSIATLSYLENINGSYKLTDTNPFAGLNVPASFAPSFVDLDGDGDKDLVGGVADYQASSIEYYKNENGVFTRQSFAAGPFKDIPIDEGNTDFTDIDNDGDFDLFISDYVPNGWDRIYYIRFYKNTGTAQSPVFTAMSGTDNPLAQIVEQFQLFPRFIDIDHDGDQDALIGEGGNVIENADGNEFSYYENTGSVTTPVFTYRGNLIQQGKSPFEPSPSFVDYDQDGDLDAFVGGMNGTITLYRNTNPSVVISTSAEPVTISGGSGSALIDSQLTLSDADNDSIVYAVVAIASYQAGTETLSYTPQAGISGSFNGTTGILTFTGKAPMAAYQAVLRTISYTYSGETPSGRRRQQELSVLSRNLLIQVKDADGTNSVAVSKTINIVSGQAPVFNDHAVSVSANTIVSVPLSTLISDADNNIDMSSLSIVTLPGSGAPAVINTGATLSIDYTNVSFAGTETVNIKVCDADNNCDQNIVTVTVINSAPVISDHSVSLPFATSVVVDLKLLISDADGNINFTTLSIAQLPPSGAVANVDVDANLTLDYAGKVFTGTETVSVTVCDKAGACDQNIITVNVVNTAPVFSNHTITLPFAGESAINLATLISDAESNIDFNTLQIVQGASSGASATVGSDQLLRISYKNVIFFGSENISVRVCDVAGTCGESIITINITNAAPVIQTEPIQTTGASTKVLNLLQITSDPDGNLDPSTLSITQFPSSGASASINIVSDTEVNLILDYSNITVSGQDQLTIRACDMAGVCTESMLSVEIISAVEIFNAVAPNSSGDNRFMRITNLPQINKVVIFNRWGDEVFAIDDYDHDIPGKRFEGIGNNGKSLASGTYFYKVEFFDSAAVRQTLTGYLSLKQ